MNNDMANFSFLTNAHTSSFSLDTYQWTYITCKEPPEVCFQFVDAFSGRFQVYVLSGFFAENMGDPYYEPTIMVHNMVTSKLSTISHTQKNLTNNTNRITEKP